MAVKQKTYIVVEGGMVSNVFSTLPNETHKIIILDLDCAESFEDKEKMESKITQLSNSKSKKYHVLY